MAAARLNPVRSTMRPKSSAPAREARTALRVATRPALSHGGKGAGISQVQKRRNVTQSSSW
jgi:hypothetical protein